MMVFVIETSIKYRGASGHISVLHKALDSSSSIYFKSVQMSLQILGPPICLMTVLLKRTWIENSLLLLKIMLKSLDVLRCLNAANTIRLFWHMEAEQWESYFRKSHIKFIQKLFLKGIT